MKLTNALSVLVDLSYAFRVAFLPTLRDILHAPLLVFRPVQLSRLFMAHVWVFIGNTTDECYSSVKSGLLPDAHGVVLEIGAGRGHNIRYLDKTKVAKYVALEPNTRMHSEIRKAAAEVGFTEDAGTFVLLPYGAEETGLINSALGGPHTIDTIFSILTFCSVPNFENSIRPLVDQVLKPGGTLLFFEHVRSRRADVFWWQRFWTPIWAKVFDGCELGRPVDTIIEGLDMWERKEVTGIEGEDPETLFVHSIGRLTKVSTAA
ncbi:hypothetical protein BDY19DRAFT_697482 [Irpex rosettiformis]|uniref:Uncharacterized protein n=1 Tax=Irpex rosettiformis TaxID=378272 RepID=A0ACB8UAU7_9APHY|nr:hypothetical protein BDY19DRAFT_697482 [Irpex rosettiformis]